MNTVTDVCKFITNLISQVKTPVGLFVAYTGYNLER